MEKLYLSKDFKEFIELLNNNNVEYIIVGGYAVGYHGYVRFTGDLDVWVNPTPENAGKLMQSLGDFGFGTLSGISTTDFIKNNSVVQLGYPPFRIDLMTSASGLSFHECYAKREKASIDNLTIPFLDLQSLKINKASTNRKKDLGDLENLP